MIEVERGLLAPSVVEASMRWKMNVQDNDGCGDCHSTKVKVCSGWSKGH